MTAPTPSSPFDPALAPAGRVPTLALLWGVFLLTVLPFTANLLRGQAATLPRELLYAAATAFLLWNVWKGGLWAWRLAVALCMFTGVLVFMGGMLAGATMWLNWVVSLAGLVFIGLGLGLVGVPSVRAFLDSQRAHQKARAGR